MNMAIWIAVGAAVLCAAAAITNGRKKK